MGKRTEQPAISDATREAIGVAVQTAMTPVIAELGDAMKAFREAAGAQVEAVETPEAPKKHRGPNGRKRPQGGWVLKPDLLTGEEQAAASGKCCLKVEAWAGMGNLERINRYVQDSLDAVARGEKRHEPNRLYAQFVIAKVFDKNGRIKREVVVA